MKGSPDLATEGGTYVRHTDYAYTPYGQVTYLDDTFSALSTQESAISNEYLYTRRRLDPETGLQLNRNRFYASHLGRWVNRDPIRYTNGSNLYSFVQLDPISNLDPYGLKTKHTCKNGRVIYIDLTDCGGANSKQHKRVLAYACTAAEWADVADDMLREWYNQDGKNPRGSMSPARKQCVENAVKKWFGVDLSWGSYWKIAMVVQDTDSFLNSKKGFEIECESWYFGDKKGYVYEDSDVIHLCPPYPPAWNAGAVADTICHEATHAGADTDDDGGYVEIDRDPPVYTDDRVLKPHDAFTNADTYAKFMGALQWCSKLP